MTVGRVLQSRGSFHGEKVAGEVHCLQKQIFVLSSKISCCKLHLRGGRSRETLPDIPHVIFPVISVISPKTHHSSGQRHWDLQGMEPNRAGMLRVALVMMRMMMTPGQVSPLSPHWTHEDHGSPLGILGFLIPGKETSPWKQRRLCRGRSPIPAERPPVCPGAGVCRCLGWFCRCLVCLGWIYRCLVSLGWFCRC